jgi:tartronate-semialdehyde synthase
MAGMCGLQTSHRYGNATMLASDFVLGIGNRWANRHTGSTEVYCKGRKFVTSTSSPRRSAACSARLRHRQRREGRARTVRAGGARAQGRRQAARLREWSVRCAERKRLMHRKTHFDRDADQAAARLRGDEQGLRRDTSTSRPSA